MSYFNYFALFKYIRGEVLLSSWLIPAKLNPLSTLYTNCMEYQIALLEECFKVRGHLLFSPSFRTFFFFKKNTQQHLSSRKNRVVRESRGAEGVSKKPLRGNLSRDGFHMHGSRSHPFSIKSLNPLSCHHCTLFQCLYCMQERHFFFLVKERKKIINLH